MKRILLLTLALCAAPLHAQTSVPAPAGWTTQTKAGGATTFTPPDLGAGEVFSVTIYDSAPLHGKTPEAFLRGFAGTVGAKAGQLVSPLQKIKSDANLMMSGGTYRGPGGTQLMALLVGVSLDDGAGIRVSRTLYSRDELFLRYQAQCGELNRILVARDGHPANSDSRPKQKTEAPSIPVQPALGPMLPADLGGAKVFVKFYWDYDYNMALTFEKRHLLLFPDGTAIDDLPREPLARWSEADVRRAVDASRVGRWILAGNTMTLTFPESGRTLTRTPRGWADPQGGGEDAAQDKVYLPAIPASRASFLGAWTNDRLSVSGQTGGALPQVAVGSTNDWVFHADGTFSGNKDLFFSATTEGGMAAGKDKNQTRGQWRLDGPLLTLQQNGVRTVHLAFLVRYGQDPELMVDGEGWDRPKTK